MKLLLVSCILYLVPKAFSQPIITANRPTFLRNKYVTNEPSKTNKQTSNLKQNEQATNYKVLVDRLIPYQAMTTIQCFMESEYLLASSQNKVSKIKVNLISTSPS
jgi:hypothetical protein